MLAKTSFKKHIVLVHFSFSVTKIVPIGLLYVGGSLRRQGYSVNLCNYFTLYQKINLYQIANEITSQFGSISSQLLRLGVSIFSNILTIFAVLVIALYLLITREKIDKQLYSILAADKAKKIERVLNQLEKDLGGWTRGELLLMFMVGFTTYLGLTILGIPFAVPLGVLAGLLEVVPNLGPVVAAIPATIVGFAISPISGFAVVALSFLVQQVENYVFVPKVMEKSAGINPVVTLLALLIGFRLAGVSGAILAVPVVITLRVIIKEYYPPTASLKDR